MRKSNIILSSISLFATVFLLIAVLYAWYVTNKVALMTNGHGQTASKNLNEYLEYYDTTMQTPEWKAANFNFEEIEPGDIFYFRFKVVNGEEIDQSYRVDFQNINSILKTGSKVGDLCVYESNVCVVDDIIAGVPSYTDLYEIVNNKVSVSYYLTADTAKETLITKDLYNVSGSTITLTNNFKIEDVMMFYDLGYDTTGTKNVLTTAETGTATVKTPNYTFIAEAEETSYHYFALEFNEAKSTFNYNGKNVSNFYQYQTFTFDNVALTNITDQN